jgi:spore maturation protein CgeB
VFTEQPLDLVIIGRSILSSFANPAAWLFRGLINELAHRGHRTTYLEPADPAGQSPRDMLRSPYCEVWTYETVDQLLDDYIPAIASADVVMLASGVAGCNRIADWIATEARGLTSYYDTDLDRTLNHCDTDPESTAGILCASRLSNFTLYLSTTGGPVLDDFRRQYGIPFARPLYQSIDPFAYYRMDIDKSYDLGFIGNHYPERSPLIADLLIAPARTTPNRPFALAGDSYPEPRNWPGNLTYLEHLPATNHVDFYNRLTCALVISKKGCTARGYTPTRQLFAAAACGVPVLCNRWQGLDTFMEPQRELYCVDGEQDVLDVLYGTEEWVRRRVGRAARERVLAEHGTAQRANELVAYWSEIAD